MRYSMTAQAVGWDGEPDRAGPATRFASGLSARYFTSLRFSARPCKMSEAVRVK